VVVKRRELEAFLRASGAQFVRIESSHAIWRRPGCKRPAVVDVKYDDLGDDLIRTILQALQLQKRDLREFLKKK